MLALATGARATADVRGVQRLLDAHSRRATRRSARSGPTRCRRWSPSVAGAARRRAAAAAGARSLGAARAGVPEVPRWRFARRSSCFAQPEAGARRHQGARRLDARTRSARSSAPRRRSCRQLAAIVPPDELSDAHALLVSAAQLADNAARIRREATLASEHDARLGRLVGRGRRADAERAARANGYAEPRCGSPQLRSDHAAPDAAGSRPRPSRLPPGHRRLDRGSRQPSRIALVVVPTTRRGATAARTLERPSSRRRTAVSRATSCTTLCTRGCESAAAADARSSATRCAGRRRAGARRSAGAAVSRPARARRRDAALLRSAAAAVAAGPAVRGADSRRARRRDGATAAPSGCCEQTRFLAAPSASTSAAFATAGAVRRTRAARAADRASRRQPPRARRRHRRRLDCRSRRPVRRRLRSAVAHAGLAALDIVAHRGVLGSGFHERMHAWWPGLEEIGDAELIGVTPRSRRCSRVRRTPTADALWFTTAIAKRSCSRSRDCSSEGTSRSTRSIASPSSSSAAAVSLSCAGHAGRRGHCRIRSSDALPLAAEPTAAALDLVLDASRADSRERPCRAASGRRIFAFASMASTDRARDSQRAGPRAERRAISRRARAAGARRRSRQRRRRHGARRGGAGAARELAPLLEPPRRHRAAAAADRVPRRASSRRSTDDDPFAERERRARGADSTALLRLAAAHAAHRRSAVDDRRTRARRPALDRGARPSRRVDRPRPASSCSTIRRRATATSTTSRSSGSSRTSGRSGRGATSSIRRAC